MTSFADFPLATPVAKAIASAGYDTPTPIQAQTIPLLLEGRDILGIAQTGTGKTAAFALPVLTHLVNEKRKTPHRGVRALILAPTRELAGQIATSCKTYGAKSGLSVAAVFGGVPVPRQIKQLKNGADVLVATPGRLLDLVDQSALRLSDVEILVLDEADQMLDLGFIHPLRRIVGLVPEERQTVLFSATMPKSIKELVQRYLTDPETVSVTPTSSASERVAQRVVHVSAADKPALLSETLNDDTIDRVLIFSRTKHGADRIVKRLKAEGREAAAIHGNKSQPQRQRALNAFRHGELSILVATDIAARGIDIPGVSHVINFDLPNVSEQYVHRIGRTGRAGAEGVAVSLVAPDERAQLRAIERLIRDKIPAESFRATANGSVTTPDVAFEDEEREERKQRQDRQGRRGGRPPQRRDQQRGPFRGKRGDARGQEGEGRGRDHERGPFRGKRGDARGQEGEGRGRDHERGPFRGKRDDARGQEGARPRRDHDNGERHQHRRADGGHARTDDRPQRGRSWDKRSDDDRPRKQKSWGGNPRHDRDQARDDRPDGRDKRDNRSRDRNENREPRRPRWNARSDASEREDRPRDNRPRDNRPRDDRSRDDRSRDDRSRDDRSRDDRPFRSRDETRGAKSDPNRARTGQRKNWGETRSDDRGHDAKREARTDHRTDRRNEGGDRPHRADKGARAHGKPSGKPSGKPFAKPGGKPGSRGDRPGKPTGKAPRNASGKSFGKPTGKPRAPRRRPEPA